MGQRFHEKAKSLQEYLRVEGTTQLAISNATKINQGSISKALKGEKNYKKYLPTIVDYLIQDARSRLVDKNCKMKNEDKENLENLLKELEVYPEFVKLREVQKTGDPKKPLSGYNRAYILRQSDASFDRLLERPPFDLVILGGPKMGKASTLNRITEKFRPLGVVLDIDFMEMYGPILEGSKIDDDVEAFWDRFVKFMTQTSSEPLEQPRPIESMAQCIEWIRNYAVPSTERGLLLTFSNLQYLPQKHIPLLLSLLHSLANKRYRQPGLDKVSIVTSCDVLFSDLLQQNLFASVYYNYANTIFLEYFDYGQVGDLAQKYDANDRNIITYAWNTFGGHPLLTHLFLKSFENKSGDVSQESIMRINDEIIQEFKKRILKKINDWKDSNDNYIAQYVNNFFNRIQKALDFDTISDNALDNERYCQQLVSSGLFHWVSQDNHNGVQPLSSEIKKEIALLCGE